MKVPKKPSHVLISLALILALLLSACQPVLGNDSQSSDDSADDSSSSDPDESNVDVDIIDVPDLSHLDVVKDYDIYNDVYQGRIGVEKLWSFTPQDYLYVSGEIPFVFPDIGAGNSSGPIPFVGYGFGSLISVIHGYGTGGSCTITTEAQVTYELRGVLYPAQCVLAFEVKSVWGNGTVTDECSGGIVIEAQVNELAEDFSRDIFIEMQNPYLHQTGPMFNFFWYVQAFNKDDSPGIPCGSYPFRIIPTVDEEGQWSIPSDLGEIPRQTIQ